MKVLKKKLLGCYAKMLNLSGMMMMSIKNLYKKFLMVNLYSPHKKNLIDIFEKAIKDYNPEN